MRQLQCIATWVRPTVMPLGLSFKYEASVKFEVGQPIRSSLITFLLLICYVTLWPWPLTLWTRTPVVYRLWLDKTLQQILLESNNPQLSYKDLNIENLAADQQAYPGVLLRGVHAGVKAGAHAEYFSNHCMASFDP